MLEPRGAAGEAESVEGLLLRVPARGGGAERGVAYNMLGMRVLAGEIVAWMGLPPAAPPAAAPAEDEGEREEVTPTVVSE